MLPTIVADKMCYGKVLIEPQANLIGSFENNSTSDILPSGLYGTILIAVFCGSDKHNTETENQNEPQDDIDLENKLFPEVTSNALISLGIASLFLESSKVDIVRSAIVFTLFNSL